MHYRDIGDYLSQVEKLSIIEEFASIEGTPWELITPNEAGDWINQRDERYDSFQPLGNKATKGKGITQAVFQTYSLGLGTNRDSWVYSSSKDKLSNNIDKLIFNFNQQYTTGNKNLAATDISWSSSLDSIFTRKKALSRTGSITISQYRPFQKQLIYFDKYLNHRQGQLLRLFPTPSHKNLAFGATGRGSTKNFSVLITDVLPDLEAISKAQWFSLYYYEPVPNGELALSVGDDVVVDGYYRRDNITDSTLHAYRAFYEDSSISREDIFYYIYALLHHPTYQETYRADLMKMLPRIPKVENFSSYSALGRQLAELHLKYETVEPYPLTEIQAGFPPASLDEQYNYYRVQKLKFGPKKDKTTIVVNGNITLKDIPLEAYEYEVNGKPALDWIIDRYQVKTDKKSLITNDPNDWCREVGDPRYIIDLIKRIVTVSLETNRLVASLPGLKILD